MSIENKDHEEARKINEGVNKYYQRPRTNKSRSRDEVAHEIIKKEKSYPIDLSKMPQDERKWCENMQYFGIRILKDGFMEIHRWEKTGKHTESPMRVRQKIDGINSAIRMQDIILEAYRSEEKNKVGEFSKLESIQEVIERANELLTCWRLAKQEEKKELQIQLADVVIQLEHCRNEFKVAAKDQSEKVVGLKDSRDRENPGALAARTVAALNSLEKRMKEMKLIIPIVALRKELLILEKRRSVGAINKSSAYITGILRHSVFREHPTKPPASRINDNEVAELNRRIGRTLNLLGTVHALPYSQQANQAKFRLMTKAKKFFSSKKNLVENLKDVKEILEDTIKILKSDVDYFG